MNALAVSNHISDWLYSYNQSAKTKGFVIGVSGGIDSAVTSTLAARTGLPVLCLEMPIHQSIDQVSRAMDHIEWLKLNHDNVQMESVDLTKNFDAFIASLPATNLEARDMALVNARARLRMTTLYYFAALNGMLVAGTGNKIEDFGIGFFTKYGDGGVDLSPIADLKKTEVYAIGKELGVSASIMKAPPTDGLWGDDRTDEDQIGASYAELEWAMDFNGDQETLDDRQKVVLNIYNNLHRANNHKMEPVPVCKIPSELK
ncbi:NAD(+) synthase [Salibacteraceae bacterium]|nr:NAD(+) synthase [Salibacteraceae bacterium]MDB9709083.1 NAD(+) synthase [Salibacteraceae bacterium]MDC1304381.1 NAD(+) synthase [Salibacteraceae bacterium]